MHVVADVVRSSPYCSFIMPHFYFCTLNIIRHCEIHWQWIFVDVIFVDASKLWYIVWV